MVIIIIHYSNLKSKFETPVFFSTACVCLNRKRVYSEVIDMEDIMYTKSPRNLDEVKEAKDRGLKSSNISSIISVGLGNKIYADTFAVLNETLDKNSKASTIMKDNKTVRVTRNRATCKKETAKNIINPKTMVKNLPVRNTPRKVLAEKQVRPTRNSIKHPVILRSSKKRGSNNLSNSLSDSNMLSSDTDKNVTELYKNEETVTKNSIVIEQNVLKESAENSDPSNLENRTHVSAAKFITRKAISLENLSLMEKLINRKPENLENMYNRVETVDRDKNDQVLTKKEETSTSDPSKKFDTSPKKKYHRRKCSEPMKNEGIQTRQSGSLRLMKNKNDDTQVSSTVKPKEELEAIIQQKECSNICTLENEVPDAIEKCSTVDQNLTASSSIGDQNTDELGNNNDLCVLHSKETDKPELTPIASTEPKPILTETNYPKAEKVHLLSPEKEHQETADRDVKPKLRHVNAQPMPVYKSKIAEAKNDNGCRSSTMESLLWSATSATDCDTIEKEQKFYEASKEEPSTILDTNSICSKTDKNSESKFPNLSNTDSEETLSNVESVPNSPAKETRPRIVGKNLKRSSNVLNPNIFAVHNVGITDKSPNSILKSAIKRRHTDMGINSTLNYGNNRDKTELRYYLESSADRDPSSIFDADRIDIENKDPEESENTPWLRHYERPQKSHANTLKNFATESNNIGKENLLQRNHDSIHQQRKSSETLEKTGIPTSENLTTAEEQKCQQRGDKLAQLINNPTRRRRGRPRKQDNEDSQPQVNAKRRRKLPSEKSERKKASSANETMQNGAALTKLESDILFFKFSQHGNFRHTTDQPPIIIYDGELYQKISARMQCYDPRKYYTFSPNVNVRNNNPNSNIHPTYSQQNVAADRNWNMYHSPMTSNSNESAYKLRSTNRNSHNFSNQFPEQVEYSRNLSSCSVQANILPRSNTLPNYMQFGYDAASKYHQNFYNNNANFTGNNSYFNSYSGIPSSNHLMNNMNDGAGPTNLSTSVNSSDNNFSFNSNTQNQYQNSMPCREIDLTMNNTDNVPGNSMHSMQKSSATDWNMNNVNQPLHSVNRIPMDVNSMNHGHESSQSVNSSSNLSHVMYNSDSATNSPNSWTNRSDNMRNNRFPVLKPWHESLPMCNPYLNNGNSYYNNMFNPYAGLMGYDVSNYSFSNMNGKNGIGVNNINPCTQNILPQYDGQSNSFDASNSEFTNSNSETIRDRTMNQGINLSLSSNPVTDNTVSQTNCTEVNNSNLGMAFGNALSSETEKSGSSTFSQSDNNKIETSARGYDDETCPPYPMQYKIYTENLVFDDVQMEDMEDGNFEKQAKEVLPEMQDYIDGRLDGFEDCFNQDYRQSGSSVSENGSDQMNNKETEITKLRRELADFTTVFR